MHPNNGWSSSIARHVMMVSKPRPEARLIRNLYLIDVRESARSLVEDPLYIKLFWTGFGAVRYRANALPFTAEETSELLAISSLSGYPVPKFLGCIVELFGEDYLANTYEASAFGEWGFDVFLADYLTFMAKRLFGEFVLPVQTVHWLLSSDVECKELGFPIPRLALASYATNDELRAQFDLNSAEGCLGLLGWMLRWKLATIGNCVLPDELSTALQQPAVTTGFAFAAGLTRLHEALFWAVPVSERWTDISTMQGASSFANWFRLQGPVIRGYELPDWARSAVVLPGLFERSRQALRKRRDEYRECVHRIKRKCLGYVKDAWTGLTAPSSSTEDVQSRIAGGMAVREVDSPTVSSGGVNVIGWPRTDNGIGEDARCAALALKSAGVPFVVVDASDRVPPSARPVDSEVSRWIGDECGYDTDIVYLDAATCFRYYAFDRLAGRSLSRRVIGVFPWELPAWPAMLGAVLDHVDVLWASTRFIKDAFTPVFHKDVRLVRPAVVVPERYWRDPDVSAMSPFTFITTFDGASSIHRKNPFAVIKSFVEAFPKDRSVRLVVKMMNLKESSADARRLNESIGRDDRIVAVTKALPKTELWNLVSSCHCFVSLHRSEGFGRNIAEAMLLGRPVICSAFSGNLDFCTDENSFLVGGALVPVNEGEYSNAKGQCWFDASVEEASIMMRQVYQDYPAALVRAEEARRFMLRHHSLEAVGAQYRDLLNLPAYGK